MREAPASLPPAVVVIAGVDPTGGAGLGADLAVLQALGCQSLPVPTAWTVQDGFALQAAGALTGKAVAAMLAPLGDLAPAAIKIGMLGTADVVQAVVSWLADFGGSSWPPVVLDPVVLATGGGRLLDDAGIAALRQELLPRAALVTPNLQEARLLVPDAAAEADSGTLARALVAAGCGAAVVTGGHAVGDPEDVLFDGVVEHRFRRPRLDPAHGTGCRFASGCAAGLAHGRSVEQAVREAGDALARALAAPRRGEAALLTMPP